MMVDKSNHSCRLTCITQEQDQETGIESGLFLITDEDACMRSVADTQGILRSNPGSVTTWSENLTHYFTSLTLSFPIYKMGIGGFLVRITQEENINYFVFSPQASKTTVLKDKCKVTVCLLFQIRKPFVRSFCLLQVFQRNTLTCFDPHLSSKRSSNL